MWRVLEDWRNRPDTEQEQAPLRLVRGTVCATYFLSTLWTKFGRIDPLVVLWLARFFLATMTILVGTIVGPAVSVPRRVVGSLVDNLGFTSLLLYNSQLAPLVFVGYLSRHGHGIAAEDCERIFTPFKQIRSKDFNTFQGTGLGLAISRQLLALTGGEVPVAHLTRLGCEVEVASDGLEANEAFVE